MSLEVPCLLISNEFIHLLQYLHCDLKGVDSLGWLVSAEAVSGFGYCRKLRRIPIRTRVEGWRNVYLKLNQSIKTGCLSAE